MAFFSKTFSLFKLFANVTLTPKAKFLQWKGNLQTTIIALSKIEIKCTLLIFFFCENWNTKLFRNIIIGCKKEGNRLEILVLGSATIKVFPLTSHFGRVLVKSHLCWAQTLKLGIIWMFKLTTVCDLRQNKLSKTGYYENSQYNFEQIVN
jgi:hypothetical protein